MTERHLLNRLIAFLLDGRRLRRETISGLRSRKTFDTIIYGQGQAMGDKVAFRVPVARLAAAQAALARGESGKGCLGGTTP